MKFIFFVLMLLEPLTSWSKEFVVATLDWPPYSCVNCAGEGAAISALRKLLRAEGHLLKVQFYSWPRSVRQARIGKVDGVWPAWAADLQGTGLVPSDVIFSSDLGIAERSDEPLKGATFQDLAPYRVGAVEGYGYHSEYLHMREKGLLKTEIVHTDLQNLMKLGSRRIDGALVDVQNFRFLLMHRLPQLKGKLQVNAKIFTKNQLMIGMNPVVSAEFGAVIKKALLRNKNIANEISQDAEEIIKSQK